MQNKENDKRKKIFLPFDISVFTSFFAACTF